MSGQNDKLNAVSPKKKTRCEEQRYFVYKFEKERVAQVRKTNEYEIRQVTLYQELSKYAFEIEKLSEVLARGILAKETENTQE